MIEKAGYGDLREILDLQYLSYQSEAALFGSRDIPPLRQTLSEVIDEYNGGVILKMVVDGRIIGSVRAKEQNGTVYIGKLMVHPDHRRRGYGSELLTEIENCFPDRRYELFTSTRSKDNIRLYQKMGYSIFDRKAVNDELEFVYMEKTAARADKAADGCIFCKLADGSLSCMKIYEDEYALAFMDIAKDVDGHIVVIPKAHCENILDCGEELLSEFMRAVKKISNRLVDNCGYSGVNLLNASGESAGQSVGHFHFHIIPRTAGDAIDAWPHFEGAKQEIKEVFKRITSG